MLRSMVAARFTFEFIVYYDEDQEQLAAADLRAFDNQRAALAKLGVGLEKQVFFLPQFQIQLITPLIRALRVDMEREILARRQPIFLPVLKRLARLTNDFELIVAKQFFEGLLERRELLLHRLRLFRVLSDNQAAPDEMRCLCRRRAYHQHDHG